MLSSFTYPTSIVRTHLNFSAHDPMLLYDCKNIVLSYDNVLFAFKLYFCSCIFGVDNFITYSYFHFYFFAVNNSARSYSYNFCLLWFLLCLSRKNDSGFCCFFCFNLF